MTKLIIGIITGILVAAIAVLYWLTHFPYMK